MLDTFMAWLDEHVPPEIEVTVRFTRDSVTKQRNRIYLRFWVAAIKETKTHLGFYDEMAIDLTELRAATDPAVFWKARAQTMLTRLRQKGALKTTTLLEIMP